MRWLRQFWPALVWAAFIFLFSTKYFGASDTASIIIPFLHRLFPDASLDALMTAHYWIRKSAHVVEFFIFSVLLLRAVRGDRRGLTLRWALIVVCIAAAYAITDELHQWFVPGRGASVSDVLLDTSGAAVAQGLAAWNAHRNEKSRAPSNTA
jgi:VanZ family protein